MTTPQSGQFPIPTIEQWITHLDELIAVPIDSAPLRATDDEKYAYIESFQDEFGARRATDRALLSRVLGVAHTPQAERGSDLDVLFWDAVHDAAQINWEPRISKTDGLVDPANYAIEHRTLIELCALHALWHLASKSERINDLIDWHTRELQPDNGINRPWGFHAFIVRSIEAEDEETRRSAMLHAQTLVNNCCITLGQPDILSALILLDGTNALREFIN